jgi:hypothetical protein
MVQEQQLKEAWMWLETTHDMAACYLLCTGRRFIV